MIYTVTLNPALDYILRLPRLSSEDVNRADSAQLLCGGKGINVSMVLSGLGVPTRALGFVAGFTGRALVFGRRGRRRGLRPSAHRAMLPLRQAGRELPLHRGRHALPRPIRHRQRPGVLPREPVCRLSVL